MLDYGIELELMILNGFHSFLRVLNLFKFFWNGFNGVNTEGIALTKTFICGFVYKRSIEGVSKAIWWKSSVNLSIFRCSLFKNPLHDTLFLEVARIIVENTLNLVKIIAIYTLASAGEVFCSRLE